MESRGYSPTLFLDLGTRRGWRVSVTPRLLSTPGEDLVPIVQEAGWASGPVWTCAKNLPPPEFDPRTVHPVASRYTTCAIPDPTLMQAYPNFRIFNLFMCLTLCKLHLLVRIIISNDVCSVSLVKENECKNVSVKIPILERDAIFYKLF
jgi:hypothetical protein